MSVFDAEELMNATNEGTLDTAIIPVPEGDRLGVINSLNLRSGTSDKGNDWAALDINWLFDDQEVIDATGRDRPTARQTVFLDIADGNLDFSKGKNVQLGRVREAVGQNGPGAWSISMLEGASALCKVVHEMYNGNQQANVVRVTAA